MNPVHIVVLVYSRTFCGVDGRGAVQGFPCRHGTRSFTVVATRLILTRRSMFEAPASLGEIPFFRPAIRAILVVLRDFPESLRKNSENRVPEIRPQQFTITWSSYCWTLYARKHGPSFNKQREGKTLCPRHETMHGGVEEWLHTFLTSVLVGDGQLHVPGALPPEKNSDIHWIGAWVGPQSQPGRFWRSDKFLLLATLERQFIVCPDRCLITLWY